MWPICTKKHPIRHLGELVIQTFIPVKIVEWFNNNDDYPDKVEVERVVDFSIEREGCNYSFFNQLPPGYLIGLGYPDKIGCDRDIMSGACDPNAKIIRIGAIEKPHQEIMLLHEIGHAREHEHKIGQQKKGEPSWKKPFSIQEARSILGGEHEAWQYALNQVSTVQPPREYYAGVLEEIKRATNTYLCSFSERLPKAKEKLSRLEAEHERWVDGLANRWLA